MTDCALANDDENLWDHLVRRERLMQDRLEFAREQTTALEVELGKIRRAMDAIRMSVEESCSGSNHPLPAYFPILGGNAVDVTATQSIKRLIMFTLLSGKYRQSGATAQEIRQFISDIYKRDIERTSLSPQLSRLLRDGLVKALQPHDLYGARWAISEKALSIPATELLLDGMKTSINRRLPS